MINTVMHVVLAWSKNTYPFNHPHNVPSHDTAFEINEIIEEKKPLLHSSYTNSISMFLPNRKQFTKRRWA